VIRVFSLDFMVGLDVLLLRPDVVSERTIEVEVAVLKRSRSVDRPCPRPSDRLSSCCIAQMRSNLFEPAVSG
jgi:hypothetical protein